MSPSDLPPDDDHPLTSVAPRADGWTSPITRRGRVIGHRQRYDNRLLFAACDGRPIGRFDLS